MKILYAANRRKGAHFQLNRFITSAKDKHTIRIAAHKGQNYDYPIDWTLDALCDVFTGRPCTSGTAVEVYRDQVRTFAPDLVISDCEEITSHIANDLDLPLWQVSPLLLWYAVVKNERGAGLTAKYPMMFGSKSYVVDMDALVAQSDKTFVYSHLCDVGVKLMPGIEWIRPYAKVGEQSTLFEHDIVGAAVDFHKPTLHRLKRQHDTVFFTEATEETHPMMVKPMTSNDYAGNIRNAKTLVIPGYTDVLADAFYNGKTPNVVIDFSEPETVMNAIMSERLKIGKAIYDVVNDDFCLASDRDIAPDYGVARRLNEEIEGK